MARFYTSTITSEKVDVETGELVESVRETKQVVSKRVVYEYTMLLGNLELLKGLSGREMRFLLAVSLRAEYESCEVDLSTALRRELAKDANVSLSVVRNMIHKLVKAKLLRPLKTGKHQLSPFLFHRGSLAKVPELRKAYQ